MIQESFKDHSVSLASKSNAPEDNLRKYDLRESCNSSGLEIWVGDLG